MCDFGRTPEHRERSQPSVGAFRQGLACPPVRVIGASPDLLVRRLFPDRVAASRSTYRACGSSPPPGTELHATAAVRPHSLRADEQQQDRRARADAQPEPVRPRI